jgi:S1-C subfamily serine protease
LGILLSISFTGLKSRGQIMLRFTNNSRKASASLIALLFTVGLLVGGLGVYYINSRSISNLNSQISHLRNQVDHLIESQAYYNSNQTVNITNQTITLYQNASYLPDLYANVSNSVVLIEGETSSGSVQGSGFVYNYSGQMVVITNYHVVEDTTSLSVTLANGYGFTATILGSDPYADLSVLSVDAPAGELKPLTIVSSSSLRVGDEVIAIGNPYRLVNSLTTGVVSALHRSEQADFTANFSIADLIQTSTLINPGNSGGPLLNAAGNVVGITNSIISDSQGLGFAVPSDTILREIGDLIHTGSYIKHPYLGIGSGDMSYSVAKEYDLNVTYGVYVGSVVSGGPSDGKLQEGDVVVAMNGTAIIGSDQLVSYYEANSLPGDVLVLTIVRDGSTMDVAVTLGTKPPAPT